MTVLWEGYVINTLKTCQLSCLFFFLKSNFDIFKSTKVILDFWEFKSTGARRRQVNVYGLFSCKLWIICLYKDRSWLKKQTNGIKFTGVALFVAIYITL